MQLFNSIFSWFDYTIYESVADSEMYIIYTGNQSYS
jgi:hypothetical protein